MFKKNKVPVNTLFPSLKELLNMLGTFVLVVLAEIIFRADTVAHGIDYYKQLFSLSLFDKPVLADKSATLACFIFTIILIVAEWLQRSKDHGLQFAPNLSKLKFYSLAIAMSLIIWSIFIWSVSENKAFIYFQF